MRLRDLIPTRAFFALYARSARAFGLLDDDPELVALARVLFFAGRLETIEPASDPGSLALAEALPEGPAREQLLRQLALARLPREQLRVSLEHDLGWTITFGPGGSIEHALVEPGAEPLVVGSDDAHASWPMLRLDELRRLAAAGRDVDGAEPLRRYVPLLLAPAVGVSDDERPALHVLLRGTGVDASLVDGLIAALEPSPPVTWRYEPRFGWINDADGSLRNPEGDCYGKAWRELYAQTKKAAHRREAEAIAARAWKAEREFAAIERFFARLG